METIRPPAVAGMFYPAQQAALKAYLTQVLEGLPEYRGPFPKAIIAPHAGYVYSGPIAATIYRQVQAFRQQIRRVVLLGPTHRVAVQGIAIPTVSAFRTPLGDIPLDLNSLHTLASQPGIVSSDLPHGPEHSLEVQLPFLQYVLDDFTLLPLAVGQASPQLVAQTLEALWGGDETLVVISSDLSHYLPYDQARQIDQQTCTRILTGQEAIRPQEACGAYPINGLILAARHHGLQGDLVDLRNSGDTAGDKNRVVGYAAFAFTPPASPEPQKMNTDSQSLGTTLLQLARQAIARHLGQTGLTPPPLPQGLEQPGATFVTLTRQGQLRGCIGSLMAHRTLLEDVRQNAVAAACRDPRFPPLSAEELAGIRVEVSLLTPPVALSFVDEADALRQLRPGVDGVIFHAGARRSTFLPQVWEQLPQPEQFMAHLKQKAGLAADYWGPDVRLERYQVQKWKEALPC